MFESEVDVERGGLETRMGLKVSPELQKTFIRSLNIIQDLSESAWLWEVYS